jgi:hypothetical protein
MYTINLEWKSFNINIETFLSQIDPLVDAPVVGTSANSAFQIHFSEEPSENELGLIQLYWDDINEASIEATSYKSASQIKAEQETEKNNLLASARSKLEILGLSSAEITAILGV